MNAAEKREIETHLLRMGLPGLLANGEPPSELLDLMAQSVNAWPGHFNRHGEFIDRHKFFRDLLAECDAKDRGEMYRALAGRLNFEVYDLVVYEQMIRTRISGLASKGAASAEGRAPAAIEVGGKKYITAPKGVATHAIVTVHCQYCERKKEFVADTPVGAMVLARKAGWQRIGKETCPKCIKKRRLVN